MSLSSTFSYAKDRSFTEADAYDVVTKWYQLHDTKAPTSEFLKLLVNKDLNMLMGVSVKSKKKFKLWHTGIKLATNSVTHQIQDLKTIPGKGHSFSISSCIRYYGYYGWFFSFDNEDQIDWILVPEENQLKIKTYIVKKGCR
jgi:hypothetical protein